MTVRTGFHALAVIAAVATALAVIAFPGLVQPYIQDNAAPIATHLPGTAADGAEGVTGAPASQPHNAFSRPA